MDAIVDESTPTPAPVRSRGPLVAGVVLGAVAAAVATVVLANGLASPAPTVEAGPPRDQGARAEPTLAPSPTPVAFTAADALAGAAAAAAQFSPPSLASGQYLRHAWTETTLALVDPDPSSSGWSSPDYGIARGMASGGWTITRSGSDYSPADPHSDWYREWGAPSVTGTYGAATPSDRGVESLLQAYGTGQPLYTEGGAPTLPEGSGETFVWYLDNMPRDPQAMLDWVIDRQGEDAAGWVEGKAGWFLIGILSYNAGDPAARAAIYQALGLLSGTTVGPEIAGTRTLTFDAHLASPDAGGISLRRYTLTIDMSTGLVTETSTTSDVGTGVIPDAVPDHRITYAMSIVDGLP
ncbi:MAG: hypothetical protein AAGC61_09190 [Microbacterium sp.]